jgi:hypothetical protein
MIRSASDFVNIGDGRMQCKGCLQTMNFSSAASKHKRHWDGIDCLRAFAEQEDELEEPMEEPIVEPIEEPIEEDEVPVDDFHVDDTRTSSEEDSEEGLLLLNGHRYGRKA